MTPEKSMPRVSQERPLFTWLVRIGVLGNILVAAVLTYFYVYSYLYSTW
jgi:hypothetical protein